VEASASASLFQGIQKPTKRARDRHARGIGRRHAEVFGDLVVTPLRLDPGDHELPIANAEGPEALLIPGDRFRFDGPFERRRGVG
jgi:hypothetical protein